MINNENYFENCIELKEPINIYVADNRPIKSTSIGTLVSYFNAYGKNNEVKMNNVFYAKEMKENSISYGKLTDNNNTILSKRNFAKIIDKTNRVTAIAIRENGLYKMKSKLKYKVACVNNAQRNYINYFVFFLTNWL